MTIKQKEQKLNESFQDVQIGILKERFKYLTSKSRFNHCSDIILSNRIKTGKLAGLIRKCDAPLFNQLTENYI